jgi:hypothetical protein
MNRRAKSCGKAAPWKPLKPGFPLRLEIPQKARDSHFSHSFNNNKLDDRDHFQQTAKTSVASLRGLIGSSRNIDRHQSGMLIDFNGIPKVSQAGCGHHRNGFNLLPEKPIVRNVRKK